MKTYKGKAIYNPSGKAGEYSQWACNFYTGCSNGCTYCYCKKGVMASTWSDKPKLKACFKDENHALEVFKKELMANLPELQKHGLFFSFTTDPMLSKTITLTLASLRICNDNFVPVKILTKRTDWIGGTHFAFPFDKLNQNIPFNFGRNRIAFGFTLTGHDELEPSASPNEDRIEAMKKLHNAGFKTWASIEPIISFYSSFQMIVKTIGFCDLYKIGLKSGVKYDKQDAKYFIEKVIEAVGDSAKIYFKDSLLEQAGVNREDLPKNCVGRDYNLFTN